MNKKQLRKLAIALLDDENGISQDGYVALQETAMEVEDGACDDIFGMVESVNDRHFLPEDHGLTADQELVEATA
jgi:hypothetical protein